MTIRYVQKSGFVENMPSNTRFGSSMDRPSPSRVEYAIFGKDLGETAFHPCDSRESRAANVRGTWREELAEYECDSLSLGARGHLVSVKAVFWFV